MLSRKELTAWEAEVDLADHDALIKLRIQFIEMMAKYHRPRKKRTRASITTYRQWRELLDRADRRYYNRDGGWYIEADSMGKVMAHAFAVELKRLAQVPQKHLGVSMSCKVPDDP